MNNMSDNYIEHARLIHSIRVMSATGGMANQATVFYKVIASCKFGN